MSNKTSRAELDPREDGDAAVGTTRTRPAARYARRWFLLWAHRVRDDAQTGRPKTIRPALALADIGAQPGFVVVNAFLRTKALERSPVPHQAELPMAVSTVIFHNFFSNGSCVHFVR